MKYCVFLFVSLFSVTAVADAERMCLDKGAYSACVELCNKNVLIGCSLMGVIHSQKGEYGKALSIYENTCKQADGVGCLGLGVLYTLGKGVKQDYSKAKKFFEKACKYGMHKGCEYSEYLNNLGY